MPTVITCKSCEDISISCCGGGTTNEVFTGLEIDVDGTITYVYYPFDVSYTATAALISDDRGTKIKVEAVDTGLSVSALTDLINECKCGASGRFESVEIPGGSFSDTSNPTEAEVQTWASTNNEKNKFAYLVGDGTQSRPDWVWIINNDGSILTVTRGPSKLFIQTFPASTDSVFTITENGGTLPTDLNKVKVFMGGVRIIEGVPGIGEYTISGSDITIHDGAFGMIVLVEFTI